MEILRLDGISKYYTGAASVAVGLSDVSLSFHTGELVAVTGESGSGKSTLAHVLGGIIPYESGELYVNGQPTSHYGSDEWEAYRRDSVSFISQDYGILVGNTVIENVENALRLGGVEKGESRERAKKILADVELSEYENRKAGKLSSGQKQRLSIARALAKSSRILIADEPTGNLDRENSDKVISLLARAASERLVIIITHEFEEVKSAATRHIVLSGGAVVNDSVLRERAPEKAADPVCREKSKKHGAPISLYVAWLTAKSRPVFTGIMCIFLAVTMLAMFVFLGTFTVSLDESAVKIYDARAFANGTPERLVVTKPDKSDFNAEEIKKINSVRRVSSVEQYSYASDFAYHYVYGEDYCLRGDVTENFEAAVSGNVIETDGYVFAKTDKFLRTVPRGMSGFVDSGRLPEGFYEVISADSEFKTGDKVEVFIRSDNMWGVGEYIALTLDVVGETDFGEGLYFSDGLGEAFNCSHYANKKIYLPFEPGRIDVVFEMRDEDDPKEYIKDNSKTELGVGEIIANRSDSSSDGTYSCFTYDGSKLDLKYAGYHSMKYRGVIIVNESVLSEMNKKDTNQISVFAEDYSYTSRVADSLNSLGYSVVSPFKAGAYKTDSELALNRIITLCVCISASVLLFVLEIILVRIMFASQTEHYRLMSNIGLSRRVAALSVLWQMLMYLLVGGTVGGVSILILNALDFSYVKNIFKFLMFSDIFAILSVFLLSSAVSAFVSKRAICRSVFRYRAASSDIDIELFGEDVTDA